MIYIYLLVIILFEIAKHGVNCEQTRNNISSKEMNKSEERNGEINAFFRGFAKKCNETFGNSTTVHSVHHSECKQSEKLNQAVNSSGYMMKNNPSVKHKISNETHKIFPVLCYGDPDNTGLHLSSKYYNDIFIIKALNNINRLPVTVVTEKNTDNLQLNFKKNMTIISSPSVLEKHRYHTTKNVVDEYVPENMIEEPMNDQIYMSSNNLKFNSDPIKNNNNHDRKYSSYSKKGFSHNIISKQLEMPIKLRHFSQEELPQQNVYRSIKISPQQKYNRLFQCRFNQLSPTLELRQNFTDTSGETNLTYIQNQINKNLLDNLLKLIKKNIIRRSIKKI